MIDFQLLLDSFPIMLKSASISLFITLASFLIGLIGGTLITLIRLYGHSVLRFIFSLYVNVVRGTPMLVQISLTYYALPLLGIKLQPMFCVIFSLGLCSATYMSEVIRAGIQAVPIGYFEAAYTLGFSNWQTARYVIFPHVVRNLLPSIGNELITLSKDSSLASVIGVVELFRKTQDIARISYDYVTMMIGIACIYILWTAFITFIFNFIEKKISY